MSSSSPWAPVTSPARWACLPCCAKRATRSKVPDSATSSRHQGAEPLNFLAPGQFTPPTTLAQQQAQQATGVYSALNSGLSGTSTTPSNRIDPRFNGVSVVGSSANSNYNSLQVYLERRFSTWYGFTAADTWSKSIDDVSEALNVLAPDVSVQQNPRNNSNNRAGST